MPDRIFTEEEISRIIRRAAELETERSLSQGKQNHKGLTLSELEDVAAESGIDPELIQQAAGEYGLQSDEKQSNSGRERRSADKTKVKGDEIVAERWVDIIPDKEIMNSLITELSHRYGASEEDITWWENLWGSYDGKPRVKRTGNSTEWNFTDDSATYSTRVLMQKRGKRFRIRVSKKQYWGTTWDNLKHINWLGFPAFIVGGTLIGHFVFDALWAGLAVGLGIYAVLFPFTKKWAISFVERHRNEISDLADELADYAMEIRNEQQETGSYFPEEQIIDIEADPEDEQERSSGYQKATTRLRNELR